MPGTTLVNLPDGSDGEGSACNAGDPSLIPKSRRSPGEGIDYPLQYSWASLVVQMVKSPPAMQETQVRPLDREDPWRKKEQPTPVFLLGNSHGQRSLVGYSPWGSKRVGYNLVAKQQNTLIKRRRNSHLKYICTKFLKHKIKRKKNPAVIYFLS